MKVRCNQCMKIFDENKIVYDGETDTEFCPECGESGCLMDLEEHLNNIGLCTFPDDDKDYCKYFEVPKDWLVDILERIDNMNERKGVNLEEFLDNYVWDETWFIYNLAKDKGKLITEKEEA